MRVLRRCARQTFWRVLLAAQEVMRREELVVGLEGLIGLV